MPPSLFCYLITSLQARVIPVPFVQGGDSDEPCERGCAETCSGGKASKCVSYCSLRYALGDEG